MNSLHESTRSFALCNDPCSAKVPLGDGLQLAGLPLRQTIAAFRQHVIIRRLHQDLDRSMAAEAQTRVVGEQSRAARAEDFLRAGDDFLFDAPSADAAGRVSRRVN